MEGIARSSHSTAIWLAVMFVLASLVAGFMFHKLKNSDWSVIAYIPTFLIVMSLASWLTAKLSAGDMILKMVTSIVDDDIEKKVNPCLDE